MVLHQQGSFLSSLKSKSPIGKSSKSYVLSISKHQAQHSQILGVPRTAGYRSPCLAVSRSNFYPTLRERLNHATSRRIALMQHALLCSSVYLLAYAARPQLEVKADIPPPSAELKVKRQREARRRRGEKAEKRKGTKAVRLA